jgi:Tol biopolymer transport system component
MGGGRRPSHLMVVTAIALGAALVVALVAHAAVEIKLVSKTADGTPANARSQASFTGGLSGDGNLVTFSSLADNLPDGNGTTENVYVKNVRTGATTLMNTTDSGDPSGYVEDPVISANGRVVAFDGFGDGLPGADGTTRQAWTHDRETGKTRLVSKNNDGEPGDHPSSFPFLSASGRFVAFESYSSNLPGGDGIRIFAYVRDIQKRRTTLVSRTRQGEPAYGFTSSPSISSNGRFVVFESDDPDLPGPDGTDAHIYLRDLRRDTTKLVDRNSAGKVANDESEDGAISGNGRFVAFGSVGTNLPGNGTLQQVFLRNLETGRTRLVSRNSAGDPQDGSAFYPRVSGNGRIVAFEGHEATNLPGGSPDYLVYTRDTKKGTTRLVSKADNGDPAGPVDNPSISLDGDWVSFHSDADNIGGDPDYRNVFRAGPLG